MNVETGVTLWDLFKTKNNILFFDPLLSIFSILPSVQTIIVIGLIVFLGTGLEKLGYFNPLPILSGLFLKPPPPTRLYIDSDPPAIIGLMRIVTSRTSGSRNFCMFPALQMALPQQALDTKIYFSENCYRQSL